MYKWILLFVLFLTLVILTAFIFWGTKLINIEQNQLIIYELTFFGAIFGGIFTLGGIMLSNIYNRHEREKLEQFERQPYISVRNIKRYYKDDFSDRFPWGGDPPPGDCFPLFLPYEEYKDDEVNDTEVVYFQIALENLGCGIAQNVRFYLINDNKNNDEYKEQAFIPVLGDKRTAEEKIYIQFPYNMSETFSYKYYIDYENYMGHSYRQDILCEITVYDLSINSIYWISQSPYRIKGSKNGRRSPRK